MVTWHTSLQMADAALRRASPTGFSIKERWGCIQPPCIGGQILECSDA